MSRLIKVVFGAVILLCTRYQPLLAQNVHLHAHAHNDYVHKHPLKDALLHHFISVEADVHLVDDALLVSHDRPMLGAPLLEDLYVRPLDSLLRLQHFVYANSEATFQLMIDLKTSPDETWAALLKLLKKYPRLLCGDGSCPVRVVLSGNRPSGILDGNNTGVSLDGRPSDLGKGIPSAVMPVVSDHFKNWCSWDGTSPLSGDELARVHDLAKLIHSEGKHFRLWAIPDNPVCWAALLAAGVDLINTDQLSQLDEFFNARSN